MVGNGASEPSWGSSLGFVSGILHTDLFSYGAPTRRRLWGWRRGCCVSMRVVAVGDENWRLWSRLLHGCRLPESSDLLGVDTEWDEERAKKGN